MATDRETPARSNVRDGRAAHIMHQGAGTAGGLAGIPPRHASSATVTPFSVSGGTAAAFVGADANTETIGWVETFVPKSSGANYIPHVTCGVAPEAFVKQLKAEPFAAFTFKPVGVAVYHLGNFGTAAKKLWQSPAAEPLASWNDGAEKRSLLITD